MTTKAGNNPRLFSFPFKIRFTDRIIAQCRIWAFICPPLPAIIAIHSTHRFIPRSPRAVFSKLLFCTPMAITTFCEISVSGDDFVHPYCHRSADFAFLNLHGVCPFSISRTFRTHIRNHLYTSFANHSILVCAFLYALVFLQSSSLLSLLQIFKLFVYVFRYIPIPHETVFKNVIIIGCSRFVCSHFRLLCPRLFFFII